MVFEIPGKCNCGQKIESSLFNHGFRQNSRSGSYHHNPDRGKLL